jgi:hypothetical protein
MDRQNNTREIIKQNETQQKFEYHELSKQKVRTDASTLSELPVQK